MKNDNPYQEHDEQVAQRLETIEKLQNRIVRLETEFKLMRQQLNQLIKNQHHQNQSMY